jgi:hypothetical protein
MFRLVEVLAGKRKLSVRRVEQALRSTGNIKTIAAHVLGVHRATLYRFLELHPRLVEFASEIQEELLDVAEAKVIQLLKDGDMPTVRWFLELKGKDRGYTRRAEVTGPAGAPIETRQMPDLSGYTDAELEQLLTIHEGREKREAAERQQERERKRQQRLKLMAA